MFDGYHWTIHFINRNNDRSDYSVMTWVARNTPSLNRSEK
jgi:hypothetical protein